LLAQRRYGRLPLARRDPPAIALAKDGIVSATSLAASLRRGTAQGRPTQPSLFFKAQRAGLCAGDRLRHAPAGRHPAASPAKGERVSRRAGADTLVALNALARGLITAATSALTAQGRWLR